MQPVLMVVAEDGVGTQCVARKLLAQQGDDLHLGDIAAAQLGDGRGVAAAARGVGRGRAGGRFLRGGGVQFGVTGGARLPWAVPPPPQIPGAALGTAGSLLWPSLLSAAPRRRADGRYVTRGLGTKAHRW